MKLDRSILFRAGAVATALAFATPALPCGDKAMTTASATPQTQQSETKSSSTKGAVASAQPTKAAKDKPAKATQ